MSETHTDDGASMTAATRSRSGCSTSPPDWPTVTIVHPFHPTLGVPALVAYTAADSPLIDPRPVAFVLSGVSIVVGTNLIVPGFPRKPIYAFGMALMPLMLVYIGGYFGWHAPGHGAWWGGLDHGWHGHSNPVRSGSPA